MPPITKRPQVKVPLAYNGAKPIQRAAVPAAGTPVGTPQLPVLPKPFTPVPAVRAPQPIAGAPRQLARGTLPQDQQVRIEKIKARLRAKLENLPKDYPVFERPNKPRTLAATHPITNKPLTFHHKLNAQKIVDALKRAARKKDRVLLEKLAAFSMQPMPDEAFIDQLFKNKPSTFGFTRKFAAFQKNLVWAPWNGFFGDLPEKRLDDPKHKLDRHLTDSGAMTPRSRLAHDVGQEFRLDVNELQRRLLELASRDASPYDENEWGNSEGMVYQASNPTPAVSVVRPDLSAAVAREDVSVVIASNDATTAVTVRLRGHDGTSAELEVARAGTRWTASLGRLDNASDYVLTVTARGAVGRTTTITSNFRSANLLTGEERKALRAQRTDREPVEVDLSGFNLFGD